ncbi:Hsp70 family protein [Luedemannella flava]
MLIEPGGDLVVGLAAWRRASEHPQRFVPAPARLAHLPTIDADTDVVPVVDLIAATLRRVATEAATHSGGPVDEVMLTVPAGWGPHRRDLLRRAAHTAGLPNAQLVPAPVAVAWHLLAHAPVADSPILVCDLGAGTTATVLRRRPGGFDILSTIEEPDAGGMAVDLAVLDAVTARARAAAPADQTTGGESPDEVSWYADLDQARTARKPSLTTPAWSSRYRTRFLRSASPARYWPTRPDWCSRGPPTPPTGRSPPPTCPPTHPCRCAAWEPALCCPAR